MGLRSARDEGVPGGTGLSKARATCASMGPMDMDYQALPFLALLAVIAIAFFYAQQDAPE